MSAVPPVVMSLYKRVLAEPTNADPVAELALALAESGERRPLAASSADIASTGGPSSLSTLLCPLFLVDMGYTVPKIGVEGRPAGGIDVLGTIPGYRTSLEPDEFELALAAAGYAHVVAGGTWAPADSALFRLRQQESTQARPALVVASLLAKKLAAGVSIAGLEARVAKHGNFGSTREQAHDSAGLYCEVAALLGLKPIVAITNGEVPYQPFIGRGEALTALSMLLDDDSSNPWLARHAQLCYELASTIAGAAPLVGSGHHLSGVGLANAMTANLEAQGSSLSSLKSRIADVGNQQVHLVRAESDGFVHYNLESIRNWVLNSTARERDQAVFGRSVPPSYPDVAGATLLFPPWERVTRGESLVALRSSQRVWDPSGAPLVTILPSPDEYPNTIYEVLST